MTAAKKSKGITLRALHPSVPQKSELHHLGGSRSDAFNNVLALQTINSLWLAHSKTEEERSRLVDAAAAALVGIGPKDEREGMLAAQMVAAHSAAMECSGEP